MKSMTYGVMPSREEFDNAWETHEDQLDATGFSFGNDSRVGNCTMSSYQLWLELNSARAEFENGNEKSGEWCSSVLSVLGFEWI